MYVYDDQKEMLFTDEGQKMFLKIRDRTNALLEKAGAVRMLEMLSGTSGDSWSQMACVDRMVELGEIKELTNDKVAGQHRVFVSNKN